MCVLHPLPRQRGIIFGFFGQPPSCEILSGDFIKESKSLDLSTKQTVKDALLQKDYVNLVRLCQSDRRFWGALRLYLFETDEDLRWPAIEASARLMKKWWREGCRDKVREYIRTQLWLLN